MPGCVDDAGTFLNLVAGDLAETETLESVRTMKSIVFLKDGPSCIYKDREYCKDNNTGIINRSKAE